MRALYALNSPLPQGFVYSLDVRAKMLVSIFTSIVTIWLSSPEAMYVLFAGSACYAISLRRPKALIIAYIVMAIMFLMAVGCTLILKELLPKLMGRFGIESLTVPFMRSVIMIHVILPMALSSRIQTILNSLRSLRLPFCIYLPAAVCIRFIPSFINDIGQVLDALKIRGHNPAGWEGVRHPVRSLRLVFAPLLFRSLRTSEDLGIAAELKGLGLGKTMISYKENTWRTTDTLFLIATAIIMALAIFCQYYFNSAGSVGVH